MPTAELDRFLSPSSGTSTPSPGWPALVILHHPDGGARAIRTAVAPDGTLASMGQPVRWRDPEALTKLSRSLEMFGGVARPTRAAGIFGLTDTP